MEEQGTAAGRAAVKDRFMEEHLRPLTDQLHAKAEELCKNYDYQEAKVKLKVSLFFSFAIVS